MIASAAEVIAAYLVSLGLASRPADNTSWPITTSLLPEDPPDNRICVTNPDTENQWKNPRTNITLTSPICQIRVRSVPSSAGYSKINDILAALTLDGPKQVTAKVPGTELITLVAVNLVSGPSYMGQEEKEQRVHHVMNVKVIVVPGA